MFFSFSPKVSVYSEFSFHSFVFSQVYLSFLFLTYASISNTKRLGRISFLIRSIFYSFNKYFSPLICCIHYILCSSYIRLSTS
jgi:hypothetical protein